MFNKDLENKIKNIGEKIKDKEHSNLINKYIALDGLRAIKLANMMYREIVE